MNQNTHLRHNAPRVRPRRRSVARRQQPVLEPIERVLGLPRVGVHVHAPHAALAHQVDALYAVRDLEAVDGHLALLQSHSHGGAVLAWEAREGV